MSDKIIAGLTNPIPILQQNSSSINTNPFIPKSDQERELRVLQANANNIIINANAQPRAIVSLTQVWERITTQYTGILGIILLFIAIIYISIGNILQNVN